jgi:hypothetical protein
MMFGMSSEEEQRHIRAVTEQLIKAHPETPADKIIAAVHSAYARFDGLRIRDFVPLFVERRVKDALRESTLV